RSGAPAGVLAPRRRAPRGRRAPRAGRRLPWSPRPPHDALRGERRGQILLVLGVTGLVQALAAQHSWRYDLTENKRFSLSPQTVQLLQGLRTDVSATGFFRSDQPGKHVTEDLFKQYARYAGAGRFTWRIVDPDREPALARRYGIESYGTVVLETKTKSEKILDAEEEKLTNGLVKVTREGKRVVY